MRTLQRIVFPSLDLCTERQLYARCSPGAWYSYADAALQLQRFSTVTFDTYFNGFSAGKWKRQTQLRDVRIRFEAQGSFEAEAVLNHPYRSPRVVSAASFSADVRSMFELPPIDLAELGEGQLYLSLRCLSPEGTVFGGAVVTDDPPARDVQLGVVITTYNRPNYVKKNLARLAQAVKESGAETDNLEILIVDNGSNLDISLPAWLPVTVVPNRNLGGSGGFARGLMRFRDAGAVSHVLFMDDDISFEPEIVFRTIEFLASAVDPDLCLAGAMLMEEYPYVQFESGAVFRTESIHPFRPIGSHVDLNDWEELVKNEIERPAGYGAWWFFAFPLHLATHNPLPVFIRGDDVCYGLRHTGPHTITMNGIGVWHQHFVQKNGPAAFYYEARNLPLVSMLASDRYSARHLTRRFVYHTTRMLLALKYDTAAADIKGMRHFLEGPDAWMARDPEQVNQEIRGHGGERLEPLTRTQLSLPAFKPKHSALVKVGSAISSVLLSGHLLPRRFSRRPTVGIELSAWSPASVLGREEVVYRYEPTGEGYTVQRDRPRFFTLFREMLSTAARIPGRFPELRDAYRRAYPTMTGDEFWRRQFDQEGPV